MAPFRAIRSNRFLELGLALEKIFDANADLRLACEDSPDFPFLEVTETQAVGLRRKRDVFDLLDQLGRILEVKFHKLFYLRLACGFLAYVDEDRPRQRLVASVFDALCRGQDRSLAVVNSCSLEGLGILRVVGEAEVAEGIPVSCDSLDQHVVVFARRKVSTAGFCLAHDGL